MGEWRRGHELFRGANPLRGWFVISILFPLSVAAPPIVWSVLSTAGLATLSSFLVVFVLVPFLLIELMVVGDMDSGAADLKFLANLEEFLMESESPGFQRETAQTESGFTARIAGSRDTSETLAFA